LQAWAKEYRRLAEECFLLARGASDGGAEASFLTMAQCWLDLAEIIEHDGWNASQRCRAIQAVIGDELQKLYGLPNRLPPRILTVLTQLNEDNNLE
jgi:hypothetical protein